MNREFLPTSAKEVERLGWDYVDVILFTGDAYIDHPSFGAAVIGRTLEKAGYRVAIVPQPNWRDDLRDFRKLGVPRLFFGISAGAMDSMVNHYTATRRLRSDDAYTAGGKAGARPDYPTVVYAKILKQLFPQTPVILGGIEASLRRLTHYDYWSDTLRPSVLVESGADAVIYGMGEKAVVELARKIERNQPWTDIKQLVYISDVKPEESIVLHSFNDCKKDKMLYGENFVKIETESNRMEAKTIVEPTDDGRFIIINPPYPYLTESEIDASFDLPYTRLPHFRYKEKAISAYEMIKHSVNIHRGCFGGCSFCTISAHQGKFISSRSERSIMREIDQIAQLPDFRGNLSDVGGPSANMWRMRGTDIEKCRKCSRPSCIFPKKCLNLQNDHRPLLSLYDAVEKHPAVKHFYIGSGIRYDLFDDRTPYLERVVTRHTSGRLKVAPEHTQDNVLTLMRKPSYELFDTLCKKFNKICTAHSLRYQIVPYFISSHPGCTPDDMMALGRRVKNDDTFVHIEQVQDFTPTPMTLSAAMYFLGINPYTHEKLYVERTKEKKDFQKSCFFNKKPYNTSSKNPILNHKNKKPWKK